MSTIKPDSCRDPEPVLQSYISALVPPVARLDTKRSFDSNISRPEIHGVSRIFKNATFGLLRLGHDSNVDVSHSPPARRIVRKEAERRHYACRKLRGYHESFGIAILQRSRGFEGDLLRGSSIAKEVRTRK